MHISLLEEMKDNNGFINEVSFTMNMLSYYFYIEYVLNETLLVDS